VGDKVQRNIENAHSEIAVKVKTDALDVEAKCRGGFK
jgi:hypothetical protein